MKENQQQNNNRQAVIVANGKFPEHNLPLLKIKEATVIICCDGAIAELEQNGIVPKAIVGDLDSLRRDQREKYADILFRDPDQDTNDLTKAVKWCLNNELMSIDIVGATGLREDHTLGNIGLLPFYARMGINVCMYTDNGYFIPLIHSSSLESFIGQQVSIFSPNNITKITTSNLKYPINNQTLDEIWMGTLNESLGDEFTLQFDIGPLIVYQSY